MTPLYRAGVYAPLPRFSNKTQSNIAPSATRNTASARCSRDAPIISVAWSSKGSLLFPCFGEPSPRYSPRHVHSGSSHRFYALRRRSDISLLDALRDSCDILLEQIERRGEEHEVLHEKGNAAFMAGNPPADAVQPSGMNGKIVTVPPFTQLPTAVDVLHRRQVAQRVCGLTSF